MVKNWVNEVLDDASKTVRSWPRWMLRPEVRSVVTDPSPVTCSAFGTHQSVCDPLLHEVTPGKHNTKTLARRKQ